MGRGMSHEQGAHHNVTPNQQSIWPKIHETYTSLIFQVAY